MAQRQQQDTVISHFSHPGHELERRHYIGPICFRCDMCWEDLSSAAYSCRAWWDFGIHDSCAIHSQTFSSVEHHAHPLILVQTGREASLLCDVCLGHCAPGSFLYRFPQCGFDMHSTCARLLRVVRSGWHPAHDLTLVVADGHCASSECGGGAGRASYYRCMVCNIDFHISCAASAGDNNNAHDAQTALDTEIIQSRLEQQGINAAFDLWSPSYTVRREYF
ncbi:hypothetical protein CFC21_106217 [Triticum aestivum]|uniref:DC1 domain-containing protein n=2 Tax=Triticum aestivum TaxID=4565 RepID=A0A3B6SQS3_WHEAT|nr:uncharacterized protein LOC123159402 [Triticum aestivum]KAF7105403.1 hypothetical protein CFC21_106217 [Triticum aestivum]